MPFNSFGFLFLFLPLALLAYYIPARLGFRRASTIGVVAASLIFYSYWGWKFLPLLIASTLFNYAMGCQIRLQRRRSLLGIGIATNLLCLGWFKYAAFTVRTVNAVAHTHLPVPETVLPLAISFYTFTQIAFLVDCYNGVADELNLPRYSLFVFFFPHLVAGPIVHHKEIMPQFAEPESRKWNPDKIATGLAWLTLGLAKKVLLADACAPCADAVFDTTKAVPMTAAWMGLLAYSFQIYFDFSGYSDMAIGLSWLFNIRLPDNFNAPYKAESIVSFWRRWHMTLSRFLRDYLYIPLGGNRGGEFHRFRNLFITMLLGGLWHGANWTFVIWGAYHGMLLIVCHLWAKARIAIPRIAARTLTFLCVVIGWAPFRAKGMASLAHILRSLFTVRLPHIADAKFAGDHWTVLLLAGLLLTVNFAPTTKDWVESRELGPRHGILVGLLFCLCLLAMRDVSLNFTKTTFIYTNF